MSLIIQVEIAPADLQFILSPPEKQTLPWLKLGLGTLALTGLSLGLSQLHQYDWSGLMLTQARQQARQQWSQQKDRWFKHPQQLWQNIPSPFKAKKPTVTDAGLTLLCQHWTETKEKIVLQELTEAQPNPLGQGLVTLLQSDPSLPLLQVCLPDQQVALFPLNAIHSLTLCPPQPPCLTVKAITWLSLGGGQDG